MNEGLILSTITAGVRGPIHEHSIDQLNKLKISKSIIKTLMKNLHQNAIKYLTYLVLNKWKLDNKTNKPPSFHREENEIAAYTTRAHLIKEALHPILYYGTP